MWVVGCGLSTVWVAVWVVGCPLCGLWAVSCPLCGLRCGLWVVHCVGCGLSTVWVVDCGLSTVWDVNFCSCDLCSRLSLWVVVGCVLLVVVLLLLLILLLLRATALAQSCPCKFISSHPLPPFSPNPPPPPGFRLAFCAIMCQFAPDRLRFEDALGMEPLERLDAALNTSEDIGIPVFVDAEDVMLYAERRSMMTQVCR